MEYFSLVMVLEYSFLFFCPCSVNANHPSGYFSLFSVYETFFSISIVVYRNCVLKLFMSVVIIAMRFIFSCGLGIPHGSAFS